MTSESTEHPPLDGPRALALLREVVAERPDYVYELPEGSGTCVYVEAGRPSCLVGQVLFRAGYSISDIELLDGWGLIGDAADHSSNIELDLDARRILEQAQAAQDNSHTWAVALIQAEREAAALGVPA